MQDKQNKLIYILAPIICFFLGATIMYGLISKMPGNVTDIITKVEKDVTITENGIADSVEKIYDAVVVVSTYKNNTLYATGTGFVYKTDNKYGYILTNNHVIENGNKVTIKLTNGEIVETNILGSDKLSDIAVLTIPKKDVIAVASLGKSTDLRVGDTSFAVGAPLDSVYSWTVTRGIISGKDRMVEVSLSDNSDYAMKVLQTDAAINSGNSGGPLCNGAGDVVGITSLKLVDESVEGMGFAITIEDALKYANIIENGGEIVHPYLGVQMYNVSDVYYSRQYNSLFAKYDITSGVLVYAVEKNSPADKGGLKESDVIVKVNNYEVTSVGYLRYYLYSYDVGETITLTVIREGVEKKLSVTLGKN